MSLLILDDVHKTYQDAETPVYALRGVSLQVARGDLVALMGPSGCGKSTLLHLAGAMDRASKGEVLLDGQPLSQLHDDQLTLLRRRCVGFVFQFFNLLPTLTVLENISLPSMLDGIDGREVREKATSLAETLGLLGRLHHYPSQLSGGEMQRVAVARAVIHDPLVVIADEPTGSLDSENGSRLLDMLKRVQRETRVALLIATHSPETAAIAGRVIHMQDGKIVRESR